LKTDSQEHLANGVKIARSGIVAPFRETQMAKAIISAVTRKRELADRLRAVGVPYAAAFAGACAERLRPVCARIPVDAPERVAEKALATLWKSVEFGGDQEADNLRSVAEACLKVIPAEDVRSLHGLPASPIEHLLASTHFALQVICRRDTKQGMWAATRLWDCADARVQQLFHGRFARAVEAAIQGHPLVADELARQERDLTVVEEWSRKGDDVRAHASFLRDRSRAEADDFVSDLRDRNWSPLEIRS